MADVQCMYEEYTDVQQDNLKTQYKAPVCTVGSIIHYWIKVGDRKGGDMANASGLPCAPRC